MFFARSPYTRHSIYLMGTIRKRQTLRPAVFTRNSALRGSSQKSPLSARSWRNCSSALCTRLGRKEAAVGVQGIWTRASAGQNRTFHNERRVCVCVCVCVCQLSSLSGPTLDIDRLSDRDPGPQAITKGIDEGYPELLT